MSLYIQNMIKGIDISFEELVAKLADKTGLDLLGMTPTELVTALLEHHPDSTRAASYMAPEKKPVFEEANPVDAGVMTMSLAEGPYLERTQEPVERETATNWNVSPTHEVEETYEDGRQAVLDAVNEAEGNQEAAKPADAAE